VKLLQIDRKTGRQRRIKRRRCVGVFLFLQQALGAQRLEFLLVLLFLEVLGVKREGVDVGENVGAE